MPRRLCPMRCFASTTAAVLSSPIIASSIPPVASDSTCVCQPTGWLVQGNTAVEDGDEQGIREMSHSSSSSSSSSSSRRGGGGGRVASVQPVPRVPLTNSKGKAVSHAQPPSCSVHHQARTHNASPSLQAVQVHVAQPRQRPATDLSPR